MTLIWPMEPTVAPSDFDPFTREVAMPVAGRDASTRVRAASKPGGVTRPVRRNLLELGLACGQGAVELDARAQKTDAARREADRAAGVGGEAPDEDGAAAEAASPREPAAIAAMASEIREIAHKRDKLAEELAGLDEQRTALQAKLMTLLGKPGVQRPTAPEPSLSAGTGPSAGTGLPPGTGLPTHRWNRTD